MNQAELNKIIEKHKLWLYGKEGGERADLQGADLNGVNLEGANLEGANLSWANIREANLRWADLEGANLSWANLRWADLSGANFEGADLFRAYLFGADLRRANFEGADLSGAYLYEANLEEVDLSRANIYGASFNEANLQGVNLRGANLRRASLSGADLREANLKGTCLDPEAPVPVPSIEEIEAAGLELKGDKVWGWRTAKSMHCGDTEYVPGQVYEAPIFSVDVNTECHPGIYLASKDWLEEELPHKKLVRCYALRNELVHACNKWRAKRLWVVEENETN